jgi:hypothetical protein
MKKFFKIFVLLMFAACLFAGCKGEVENGTPEEVDEPDDLTRLDKVQRLFSDEDIAELTQNISNPSDYIFPDGNYRCQFLISSVHDGVQVIESCVWGFKPYRIEYNYDGKYHVGGNLTKDSNYIVLIASSKTAKQRYDFSKEHSPEYFESGYYSVSWQGWKGLIGLYDDGGTDPDLFGYTVEYISSMVTNNSSMQTNSANDKFYIHKTVNGTDIQICMMKED